MADVKEEPPDDSGADDEIVRIDDEDGNVDGEDQIVILEYEQNLMVDTMEDDVLFITGRGLGLERLFLHHLAMYSDQKLLVFVLNTSQQDESFFLSRLREMAKGEGNAPPKLINADVPTKDRESIYLEGGVQFITSRILLVDLLCGRVPEEHVAGIVVWRAHHVLTSFQESFILRIYRERKKDGFVKAFSDFPTTLSSLGELQRLVSRLYVRRVRIVPRFDTDVKRSFDKAPLPSSELVVDLPPLLRRCLSTLVELIKVCGRELKATVAGRQKKDTSGEEAEEESMAGVAYAPTALEKEIADKRSFATEKQQRLLSDLAQLRDLLRTAEDIDACTMMTKIQAMRTERERSEDAPAWMLSSLAQRLFGDVETLAGAGKQKDSAQFQPPPKWTAYAQVLEEIAASPVPPECTEKGPAVLVFTSDDVLTRQLSDLTRVGCDRMAQMVRSQVPGASYGRSPTAPFGPMWPHDDVTTFMRNQEDHGELIKTLQTNQKTAARATKRRRAVAEGMMSTRDGGVQTTILQFGILHHKKKRSRRGARGDEEEEVSEK